MGWLSYNSVNLYPNGKVNRKAECDSIFNWEDEVRSCEVLKSAMVGSVYYAAVRSTNKSNGMVRVTAAVCLTSSDKKNGYNFCYKDMDESMGPCERRCPNSILDLLTEAPNEWAEQWRKDCREYNASKSQNTGSLRIGSIVSFVHNGTEYTAKKSPKSFVYSVTKKADGSIERIPVRVTSRWIVGDHYAKISPKSLNNLGFKVVHAATAEEEQAEKQKALEAIK